IIEDPFEQVRNWTKDVKLFEKDYIIMSVNENRHWYLVIACFPGSVPNFPVESEMKPNDHATNGVLHSYKTCMYL
ncbi:hypothetical protein NPIL_541001, partial [Nephila pilipes]